MEAMGLVTVEGTYSRDQGVLSSLLQSAVCYLCNSEHLQQQQTAAQVTIVAHLVWPLHAALCCTCAMLLRVALCNTMACHV